MCTHLTVQTGFFICVSSFFAIVFKIKDNTSVINDLVQAKHINNSVNSVFRMTDLISPNILEDEEEGSSQAVPRRSEKDIPKKDRKERTKTTRNESSLASCSSSEPRYVMRDEFTET